MLLGTFLSNVGRARSTASASVTVDSTIICLAFTIITVLAGQSLREPSKPSQIHAHLFNTSSVVDFHPFRPQSLCLPDRCRSIISTRTDTALGIQHPLPWDILSVEKERFRVGRVEGGEVLQTNSYLTSSSREAQKECDVSVAGTFAVGDLLDR